MKTDTVVHERAHKSHGPPLEGLLESLARLPVPKGYRVEITDGTVCMSPRKRIHRRTRRLVMRALKSAFGADAGVRSGMRISFPEQRNSFVPDVVKLSGSARGQWRVEDIEFIGEVITPHTAANGLGGKKAAYAGAGVPLYLIIDPYTGRTRAHTLPKDGEYTRELAVIFGAEIGLTIAGSDLPLKTDGFPRG
ncbi:Uma2 family endonuclease [Streptomyces sp. NPDC059479]|uniref:Uma2 family endonuclease n=1 Tax=Streptomyces sp. NPDC059479 TaxID=3346848 RepID=UPI0036756507